MDYRLSVDRANLIRGLILVRKTVRRVHRAGHAIIGFDGTYLTVEVSVSTIFDGLLITLFDGHGESV